MESKWYIVIKITISNWNGIPDLLILTWNSRHFWCEVKKPDGVLSVLQKFRIKSLSQLGDKIIVAYGYEHFVTEFQDKIQEDKKI